MEVPCPPLSIDFHDHWIKFRGSVRVALIAQLPLGVAPTARSGSQIDGGGQSCNFLVTAAAEGLVRIDDRGELPLLGFDQDDACFHHFALSQQDFNVFDAGVLE